jgi:UDP-N-acetylmuramoylalanine--D-glutamate ligase
MRAAADDLRGKRVTVMGLGVLGGGVGVARYLATQGALVTVTDQRSESELADSIAQLADLPMTYHLGEHDDRDFTLERTDIVVRNPGVRRDSKYLTIARADGVAIEMEMSLFFRACAARVIGVTGTKGKTTVTALIGKMLREWRADSFVAGNMGISALEGLARIDPTTPVAIELSSWQLEAMDEHRLGPHVAVITNFSEDHLDRYKDYEDYVETKRSIAHHLESNDVVVFNNDDVDVRKVQHQTLARALPFGSFPPDGDGAWIEPDRLISRFGGQLIAYPLPKQLSLSGEHGRLNALAAIAACQAYGVPEHAIGRGLESFMGVENRLEDVGTINGVRYINDTSATAPVATVSALRLLAARPGNVILITGGADKQSDMTQFLDVVATHAAHVVLLPGSATDKVQGGLRSRGFEPGSPVTSMSEAVARATVYATAGDVVILSPGLASFGLFRNEFDRGEQFRQAVRTIAAEVDT